MSQPQSLEQRQLAKLRAQASAVEHQQPRVRVIPAKGGDCPDCPDCPDPISTCCDCLKTPVITAEENMACCQSADITVTNHCVCGVYDVFIETGSGGGEPLQIGNGITPDVDGYLGSFGCYGGTSKTFFVRYHGCDSPESEHHAVTFEECVDAPVISLEVVDGAAGPNSKVRVHLESSSGNADCYTLFISSNPEVCPDDAVNGLSCYVADESGVLAELEIGSEFGLCGQYIAMKATPMCGGCGGPVSNVACAYVSCS